MKTNLFRLCLLVCVLALLASGCGEKGRTSITGQIVSSKNVYPPGDAVIWVQLQEIAGGYPKTLGKQSIPWPGQCPIPFAVAYNAEDIDPFKTYTLLVTLETRAGKHGIIYAGRKDVITFFRSSSNVEVEIYEVDWEQGGQFGP